MSNKLLSYVVTGFLLLPLIGTGNVVGLTKASQVHAQEDARNGSVSHLSMMSSMIDGEDRNTMIDRMKKHHGENWKEGCIKMMELMDMES